MIAYSEVVAEVHKDGDVIIYEPSAFDRDDVASFLDLWGPMEDRNFFLVQLTIEPLKEQTPDA